MNFSEIKNFVDQLHPENWMARVTSSRWHASTLIGALVFAVIFPLIALRGYHYEEGLTVAFAKEALQGDVLYPELYGYEFTERPVLLSWIIAAISYPFGKVTQITTRIPVVLALFAGAMMLFQLVSSYSTRRAALFAAFCFVCSPLVIAKAITAESDVCLTVTQFGAFLIWWGGYRLGKVSLWRWCLIGFCLAATAAFKGPQPAAFFALGIGGFLIWKRKWTELPGYALAGIISGGLLAVWYSEVNIAGDKGVMLAYMRLTSDLSLLEYLYERLDVTLVGLAQFLPMPLILLPAWLSYRKRKDETRPAEESEKLNLIQSLAFYAGFAGLILYFWPGASVRYAMPALIATAAIAGLCYESILESRSQSARLATGIVLCVLCYQVFLGWIAAPLLPDKFRNAHSSSAIVKGVLHDSSETLYAEFRKCDAILAYLDRPIIYLDTSAINQLAAPALVLMQSGSAESIQNSRTDITVERLAHVTDDRGGIVLLRFNKASTSDAR